MSQPRWRSFEYWNKWATPEGADLRQFDNFHVIFGVFTSSVTIIVRCNEYIC